MMQAAEYLGWDVTELKPVSSYIQVSFVMSCHVHCFKAALQRTKLHDCAETHDLAVTNTYFKKRDTHLATYTSGGHATQIDYWMIRRRDLKLVSNTKVILYDSVVPQHCLLVMDIRLDPLCQTRKPVTGPERIKWWKMKEQRGDLAASSEAMWNEAVAQIHQAGARTLGKTKPG